MHFRNIQGGFLNFRETFIDNGDLDMLKMARVFKEVGYDGMLQPDHMPLVDIEGPNGSAVVGHTLRARLHQGDHRGAQGRSVGGSSAVCGGCGEARIAAPVPWGRDWRLRHWPRRHRCGPAAIVDAAAGVSAGVDQMRHIEARQSVRRG